ncbi:MAG: hypothetical protein F6K26_50720 [Moorea sp. SIO2I5]|nr:hypothetical protein [Moorena sp. SIO2I5]
MAFGHATRTTFNLLTLAFGHATRTTFNLQPLNLQKKIPPIGGLVHQNFVNKTVAETN